MPSKYYDNLNDKEFDESREFSAYFKNNEELTNQMLSRMKLIREDIRILTSEQDEDWKRDRRSEFLVQELLRLVNLMPELKLFVGFPVWAMGGGQELKDIADKYVSGHEDRYARLYKELAYINRGDKKIEGDITEEIKEACRNIPIEDHIDTQLKDMGNGRRSTQCPVHEETKPSFVIYPDNSFHCFGCGLHGNNSIDFIMEVQGCSFPEAIKYLRNTNEIK